MAFGVSAEYRMKTSTRRDFLNAAATAISGVVAGGAAPPSLATAAPYDADAMATEISAKLFADDGLARPIPETPTVSDLAKGLDRTLVLGGGGEYYVAWYCGFFHGLYELEHVPPQLNQGDSRGAEDGRGYRHWFAFGRLGDAKGLFWGDAGASDCGGRKWS